MTEYDIIEIMAAYGGGFVQSLAACWRAADSENKKRLHAAFKDYFDHYREMAELRAKQLGGSPS